MENQSNMYEEDRRIKNEYRMSMSNLAAERALLKEKHYNLEALMAEHKKRTAINGAMEQGRKWKDRENWLEEERSENKAELLRKDVQREAEIREHHQRWDKFDVTMTADKIEYTKKLARHEAFVEADRKDHQMRQDRCMERMEQDSKEYMEKMYKNEDENDAEREEHEKIIENLESRQEEVIAALQALDDKELYKLIKNKAVAF